MKSTNDHKAVACLRPYTIEAKWRKLDYPITLGSRNGTSLIGKAKRKRVERYLAPLVVEWFDETTGEILSDPEARTRADYRYPVRTSERQLQREFILSELRPEVRAFAQFVLKFRNRRRGLTPGIDQLARWYAQLTGKQTGHVRRYIAKLEDAKVIAGRTSSVLYPLWQLAGSSTFPADHLREDIYAEALFLSMLNKSRAPEIIAAKFPPPSILQSPRSWQQTPLPNDAESATSRSPATTSTAPRLAVTA
ncbi:hypothetical protein [Caballeronia sp. INDeC2]|uniref:hypothetical protein n=1 Tax=Caballeronia sp. INDeC2 TaxID=2921747 RepID=UPI0020289C80|nr:hypothetical protein [Caballeronia sp. INDeC2]